MITAPDPRLHLYPILAIMAVLVLASLAPVFGHGWLGHGVYKIALLVIPIVLPLALRDDPVGTSRAARGTVTRRLLLAAGIGALLGAAALAIAWWALPSFVSWSALRQSMDARFHYSPVTATLAVLLLSTVNAGLEEWFYRGWADRSVGVDLSTLAFALQHVLVLTPLAGLPTALLAGMLVWSAGWTWSRIAKQDGLLAAWCSHVAADVVLFTGGLILMGYWS